MVQWPLLFIGIGLIALGVAFAGNWRRWADRYARFNRSIWGRLAGWYGSPGGVRAYGIFMIGLGLVLVFVFVASLVAPPPHQRP